jgi:hypothetical protein
MYESQQKADMQLHAVLDYQSGKTRELDLVDLAPVVLVRPTVMYNLDFPYPPNTPAEQLEYSERVFRRHKSKGETRFYREDRKHRAATGREVPRCHTYGVGPVATPYVEEVAEGEAVTEETRKVCEACYRASHGAPAA